MEKFNRLHRVGWFGFFSLFACMVVGSKFFYDIGVSILKETHTNTTWALVLTMIPFVLGIIGFTEMLQEKVVLTEDAIIFHKWGKDNNIPFRNIRRITYNPQNHYYYLYGDKERHLGIIPSWYYAHHSELIQFIKNKISSNK